MGLDIMSVRLVNCARCDGNLLGSDWRLLYYNELERIDKDRINFELELTSIRVIRDPITERPYCPACWNGIQLNASLGFNPENTCVGRKRISA